MGCASVSCFCKDSVGEDKNLGSLGDGSGDHPTVVESALGIRQVCSRGHYSWECLLEVQGTARRATCAFRFQSILALKLLRMRALMTSNCRTRRLEAHPDQDRQRTLQHGSLCEALEHVEPVLVQTIHEEALRCRALLELLRQMLRQPATRAARTRAGRGCGDHQQPGFSKRAALKVAQTRSCLGDVYQC